MVRVVFPVIGRLSFLSTKGMAKPVCMDIYPFAPVCSVCGYPGFLLTIPGKVLGIPPTDPGKHGSADPGISAGTKSKIAAKVVIRFYFHCVAGVSVWSAAVHIAEYPRFHGLGQEDRSDHLVLEQGSLDRRYPEVS